MIVWVLAAAVGAIGVPIAIGLRDHYGLRKAFDRVATAVDGVVEGNIDGLWKTRGTLGGIPVKAEVQRGSRAGTHTTQLNVKTERPELLVANADLGTWLDGVPLEPEEVLDGPMTVPLQRLMLYRPEVESALREIEALGGHVEIMDGHVGGYLTPFSYRTVERFCAAVVSVALAFEENQGSEISALRPVVFHSDPAVRRRALSVLLDVAPEAPLTQEAIASALTGDDPWARFLAAPHSAPLDSWAALALDGEVPQKLRQVAVVALTKSVQQLRERSDLVVRLAARLGTVTPSLLVRWAQLLAAGHTLDATILAERLPALAIGQRRSLLRLLAEQGYEVEPLCVAELSQQGEARLWAIEWLHHHGGLGAIEGLTAVPESWDHAHSKAHSAVVAIQERAGARAIDGGLSVVEEADPGQLSLAADRQGGLSETES